jgi:hypothetical protein
MNPIWQLQVGEKYDFYWSSAAIWPGDTISTITWTVPAGLTKSMEAHTDTLATIGLERTAPGLLIVTGSAVSAGGRVEKITWLFTD